MRDFAQPPKKDFSINRDMNDHEYRRLGSVSAGKPRGTG